MLVCAFAPPLRPCLHPLACSLRLSAPPLRLSAAPPVATPPHPSPAQSLLLSVSPFPSPCSLSHCAPCSFHSPATPSALALVDVTERIYVLLGRNLPVMPPSTASSNRCRRPQQGLRAPQNESTHPCLPVPSLPRGWTVMRPDADSTRHTATVRELRVLTSGIVEVSLQPEQAIRN
jgi:hypothetical protein